MDGWKEANSINQKERGPRYRAAKNNASWEKKLLSKPLNSGVGDWVRGGRNRRGGARNQVLESYPEAFEVCWVRGSIIRTAQEKERIHPKETGTERSFTYRPKAFQMRRARK